MRPSGATATAGRPPSPARTSARRAGRLRLHRAEGDAESAHRRLIEAAELFRAAGQPLDANRCLA